jgi:hypothetical protein
MMHLRPHFLRATIVALVVGTMLIMINHGDHLLQEPHCRAFYLKLGLTYLVPFAVSLYSSLAAARKVG